MMRGDRGCTLSLGQLTFCNAVAGANLGCTPSLALIAPSDCCWISEGRMTLSSSMASDERAGAEEGEVVEEGVEKVATGELVGAISSVACLPRHKYGKNLDAMASVGLEGKKETRRMRCGGVRVSKSNSKGGGTPIDKTRQ